MCQQLLGTATYINYCYCTIRNWNVCQVLYCYSWTEIFVNYSNVTNKLKYLSTIVTNKRQLLLQMNINICQLYILYIVQWTELLIIFLLTSFQCILGDSKQKQKLNTFYFCLQLNPKKLFLNIAAIHSLQNVQHIPPTSLLATELQTLNFFF